MKHELKPNGVLSDVNTYPDSNYGDWSRGLCSNSFHWLCPNTSIQGVDGDGLGKKHHKLDHQHSAMNTEMQLH